MSDSLLTARPTTGTWQRHELCVEYGLGVLEEIRRTVQEGFHKIPHGGVETGGVLYGERLDGRVLVTAWRPMQCEHPAGPRFELSAADQEALAVQLGALPEGLEGRQVVGWFASHSRGALQLRSPDVDLHEKFFREPWHIILLLCASRHQPMQASFYSRMDGTLGAAVEVPGFEVVPNPTALPRATRRAHGSTEPVAGAPRAHSRPTRIVASQFGHEQVREPEGAGELAAERAAAQPMPAAPEMPGRNVEPPVEAYTESVITAAEAEREAPKFGAEPASARRFPLRRLAWVAAWLAAAGAGVFAISQWMRPAVAKAEVQVSEIVNSAAGQLAIRWSVPGAGSTDAGQIEVVDGGKRSSYPLAAGQARAGTLTYWRQTPNVEVRLAVKRASGEQITGQAKYQSKEAAPRDGSNPALDTLRDELIRVRRQGRKLEREIAAEERKPER